MKGFALIVLCALVAVQARHTGIVKSPRALAALGENPWVLHLRVAVSTSGLLETGGAVLIDSRWILTAASVVKNARFIWVRYGAVYVISPQLVTENSIVVVHPNYNAETGENNIALININRNVETTDNIAPIGIAAAGIDVSSGKFCSYGVREDGNPGEQLSCSEVAVEQDGSSLVAEDSGASRFDVGGPLVVNSQLVGVLASEDGIFTNIDGVVEWIESETGLLLRPEDDGGDDNGGDDNGDDDNGDDDSGDDDNDNGDDDNDDDDNGDDDNGDDDNGDDDNGDDDNGDDDNGVGDVKVDPVHFVN